MAGGMTRSDFPGQLDTLFALGRVGELSDGQLLGLAAGASEAVARAAFSALIERHGPMVMRACRHASGDIHDAQDAFQSTFLVLAHKSASVRDADSLASWLHGVALRVAARTRSAHAVRRLKERRGAASRPIAAGPPEACPELHEEIARLPDKYREPLILCYLEGLTTDEAARRLHCPKGTVLSRLARGRDRLRDRLTRRGLAPVAGLLVASSSSDAATVVPPSLIVATTRASSRVAIGAAPDGTVAASVIRLTEGALRTMIWTKLRIGGLACLTTAALAFGAVAGTRVDPDRAERPGPPQVAPQEPVKPAVKAPEPALFVPLPKAEELHRLLRRVSTELVEQARTEPAPVSWALITIASAQARAGDVEGARSTFAAAVRGAGGEFAETTSASSLWRVGHSQAEAGFKDEARATFRRAVQVLHGGPVEGNGGLDRQPIHTFSVIAQEQVGLGAREDARETVDQLLVVAKLLGEDPRPGYQDPLGVDAPELAAALAVVGDFEGAFRTADRRHGYGASTAGKVAVAASKYLDREAAGRFVRESARRLAKFERVEESYAGLIDLAEAQARIGDYEAARRSARAIGEGPTRGNQDMTDGQPYALLLVAKVQHKSGDAAGARETLRDGFRSIVDHPAMRGPDGRCGQIAWGQIGVGDLEGASRSIDGMKEYRSGELGLLAQAQAARGLDAEARATLARAVEEASRDDQDLARPDPANPATIAENARIASFHQRDLAEVQAMTGDIAAALRMLRTIQAVGSQNSAIQKIVAARATSGDVAGAVRLALEESRSPAERRLALEGVGTGVENRFFLELPPPPR